MVQLGKNVTDTASKNRLDLLITNFNLLLSLTYAALTRRSKRILSVTQTNPKRIITNQQLI